MTVQVLFRAIAVSVGVTIASFTAAIAAPTQLQVTQSSGNVAARVSYQRDGSGLDGLNRYQFSNARLTITRSGNTVFDNALPIPESDRNQRPFADSLQIRDLDGDGEPEIWLDFLNNPSNFNCCRYSLIYRYDDTQKTYTLTRHDWNFASYELRDFDANGTPEFFGGDSRFVERLNLYGYSVPPLLASLRSSNFPSEVLPLQIWRFQQGRMVDVTRQYPAALASHATLIWLEYSRRIQAGNTGIRVDPEMKAYWIAYLADKHSLGQSQEGWRVVEQTYQARDRQDFFNRLRRLLTDIGYTSSAP